MSTEKDTRAIKVRTVKLSSYIRYGLTTIKNNNNSPMSIATEKIVLHRKEQGHVKGILAKKGFYPIKYSQLCL